MKNEIIRHLLKAYLKDASFVSGAWLSALLGVSRAAISKTIAQLAVEGYPIESQKHYGYRLTSFPEKLDESTVSVCLEQTGAARFAQSVHAFATVDSTNLAARRGAEAGDPDFSLYLADEQTAGRGRRGRTWRSAREEGLWFSLLLKPDLSPDRLASITLFAGLCLAAALREQTGLDIQLKWPNDLVVLPQGKKLGGILTETLLEENRISAVIIGIGINLTTKKFPAELDSVATSLMLELKPLEFQTRGITRATVLQHALNLFETRWSEWLAAASAAEDIGSGQTPVWLKDYQALCATLNRSVKITRPDGQIQISQAIGLTDQGDLILLNSDGSTEKVTAGEVSVRGLLGYL